MKISVFLLLLPTHSPTSSLNTICYPNPLLYHLTSLEGNLLQSIKYSLSLSSEAAVRTQQKPRDKAIWDTH